MWLLQLAPEIQERVLAMPQTTRRQVISERALRPIAHLEDLTEQKSQFHRLLSDEL